MDNSKSPNDEDFQQLVVQLREWLEKKPYVPKNIEDKLYRRFVHSCFYDLDKAKTAGDLFFSMRSTSPEFFTDRDPLSPEMQKTLKITNLIQYRISGNRNLWISQLNDPGLQQFNHLLESKFYNLVVDAWLLSDDFLEEEDIFLTDAKDLSVKIFFKYSYSVMNKMLKYQQEGLPTRVKAVHVVNAPSIMNKVFAIMKPFLNKEMIEMIHFHTPKSTTLFDYVHREELPEEYGGTRGTMAEYVAETIARLMKYREYLIDDNLWRVDPSAYT